MPSRSTRKTWAWSVVIACVVLSTAPASADDLTLDEVVRGHPVAAAQVDTLLDDLARLEYEARLARAECKFQQDSLNYEIRYLKLAVNQALEDGRAWYDSLLFGFVVGAGVTTALVWGLKSL